MQPNLQTAYSPSLAESRHKVLRNTYALLGLSMIPTVIGALIGVSMNFGFLLRQNPIMGIVATFAIFYGLVYAIERNRYSSTGIYLMLGFTFVMGLLLAPLLQSALGLRNGGALIAVAGGATGAIFLGMAAIGATTKRDLSGLGSFLMAGAIVLMLAVIANIVMQMPAMMLAISCGFALFSSLMIMYQVKVVVDGGEDSYISAALTIYIQIYNLFTSLLRILMVFAGDRD
ncbi:Bax inhibitor-1/YccA family protein [Paludibacterium paludis]|uniref:BAX inhibitor protein n=1 Tax=Paludibacterium paludis TaxID=1225769 RepID=A0A918P329_9NEIS|nr:Bax inhibitor-1/YccA family protein [Paludibacterium paludis]GGY17424.1 BAX inhibitor protein [Paludibacterium paludis]